MYIKSYIYLIIYHGKLVSNVNRGYQVLSRIITPKSMFCTFWLKVKPIRCIFSPQKCNIPLGVEYTETEYQIQQSMHHKRMHVKENIKTAAEMQREIHTKQAYGHPERHTGWLVINLYH